MKTLGVHYCYNKTCKWKEFLKSYKEKRHYFENLEDEKFNPWRENRNLQNTDNF